jgi:hypothetical protein
MSNAIDGGMLVPVPSMAQMFPSGNYVDLLVPDYEQIEAEDIAHHLSMLCRYGGGVRRFYSVAEHCCLVHDLLAWQGQDPEIVKAGLLHDAAEAYLGDIIAPLKYTLRLLESRKNGTVAQPETFAGAYVGADAGNELWFEKPPKELRGMYSELTDGVERAIAAAFEIDAELLDDPAVKLADMWALKIEARELTSGQGKGWRYPGEIPNGGELPPSVHWAAGRNPFSAGPQWLGRLVRLGA